MEDFTLVDDFGRRTVFTGVQLVDEHTDTEDGRKPQWVEIGVWRTEGGSFVVQRTTQYRIRHAREACPRADGYELVSAGSDDTYLCPTCNKGGSVDDPGYAQVARVTVEAYHNPQDLIDSFQQDGRYSNLARSILAELSEQDESIDAAWNTVVVP